MIIEEKAKAYDEALKRAKEDISSGILARRETARYIFPELKESEDEEIRNGIINYLSWIKDRDGSYMPNSIPFDDMLAWLEKQSEENMIEALRLEYEKGKSDVLQEQRKEWNEEDERIRKWIINEIKIKHHNLDEDNVDFVDKAIAWLEKQNKQILANSAKTCKDEQKLSNLESIGENWSEEDEENLYLTIAAIEKKYSGEFFLDKKKVKEQVGTGRKLLDWLYSFQDRVKPQPKQEWSEEDGKTLDKLITNYESGYLPPVAERCEYIIWLKSLKSHPRLELSAEDLEWFEKQGKRKSTWSEEDEKEWKSIVSVLTRMHFLDELDWLRSKLNR